VPFVKISVWPRTLLLASMRAPFSTSYKALDCIRMVDTCRSVQRCALLCRKSRQRLEEPAGRAAAARGGQRLHGMRMRRDEG
jgi:hypothetical protein